MVWYGVDGRMLLLFVERTSNIALRHCCTYANCLVCAGVTGSTF